MGAKLVLGGSTPIPPNSKINKTARSTVKSVPYRHVEDTVAYLAEQRDAGAYLVALEWTDVSHSLLAFELPPEVRTGNQSLILLPGSEATGIREELLSLCDVSVHLPMHGQNTSLNVAVALGTAAYLLLGQLREASAGYVNGRRWE